MNHMLLKPWDETNQSQVLSKKRAILDLLETEQAQNLTQAAEKLNIPKIQAHHWVKSDTEFADRVKLALEIVADRMEQTLDSKENVIGMIFRLKKLRPEYKDDYKFSHGGEAALVKLLIELRNLALKAAPAPIQIEAPKPIEAGFQLIESSVKTAEEQAKP